MEEVSISEFKAKLSHYLRMVQEGQVVVVMDRGKPVARVSQPGARPAAGSGLGMFAGSISWAEDAFDPTPEAESQGYLNAPLVHLPKMVAENDPPPYDGDPKWKGRSSK